MTANCGVKRPLEMSSCLHQLDFRLPGKTIRACPKKTPPNLSFQNRFQEMPDGLNYKVDERFVDDMCSYGDSSQYSTLRFLSVAGQYVLDLGNTNVFSKLLEIQGFLFERTDCELRVPFTQFPLISVAFVSGYTPSGRVNTSRTVPGLSHRYFKCRGYQKLECKAKLSLTISLQGAVVGIKFKEGHLHDIEHLHMLFTPSTIRNSIVDYAQSDSNFCNEDIRRSLTHRIGRGLTEPEKIDLQTKSGLPYMRCDYVKTQTQVRPIVAKYRRKRSGTGCFPVGMSDAVSYLKGSLLVREFELVSAFVIASEVFPREMVTGASVCMMDSTFDVAYSKDLNLLSIAYRDQFGSTQVGATALISYDESADDIKEFLNAVIDLAHEKLNIPRRDVFWGLSAFLIDESAAEEKALEDVFNEPRGLDTVE